MQLTSIIIGIAIPVLIALAMLFLPASIFLRRSRAAQARLDVEAVDIRNLERQLKEEKHRVGMDKVDHRLVHS